MKIYYAHPMSWYGTKEERWDIARLIFLGHVENPNARHWDDAVKIALSTDYPVMQLFADYIRNTADVVAFRAFYDGKIGAGVAREVFEARIWGKRVVEIGGSAPDRLWVNEDAFQRDQMAPEPPEFYNRILTVRETKDRIARKQL